MVKRLLLPILLLAALVSACSSSPSTAPTTPAVTTPTTFSLTGTVTSASGAAISGAVVRIVDGANAGKSTTTNSSGAYSFTGLAVAGQTVSAAATNFVSVSKGVSTTGNQTLDFQLTPTPLFTASGSGNTVFDMPTTVSRVRIIGTYTGSSSNFIVRIGSSLVVNDIIGTSATFGSRTVSDGIYLTTGGVVSITNSLGVTWSFTEVRQ